MRLRFALAAALPALAALALMALLADALARRALEAELGARLVTVAQAAAAELPAERVAALAPGDEGTRTYAHLQARLASLARATGTRLAVVRLDRTALADSAGTAAIGAPLPALERDRYELSVVAKGRAVPSEVLFEGADGELYKSGYAPLADGRGRVLAVVAAEGTAPSFATLRRFRRLLLLLTVGGAVLGALASGAAAVGVTRPLRRLAAAARRIGAGDLATPLPPAGAPGEVEALRRTLDEMREALLARDREREAMLAAVAHEVRNPLGAMELFAAALADDVRGRPEAAHVARIRSELAALDRLVTTFLEFARERPPRREPLEAAQLVEEVRDLVLPLARERGVALEATGAGALSADRDALRRAALNLVRNAVEASSPGTVVELSLRVAAGEARLEVLDRGAGLTDEARRRAGEPFFTTKERGTGLGLALAARTAAAHGGRLELAPRPGGGAAARLAFPAEAPAAAVPPPAVHA